jgi:hypothetical protein
MPCVRKPFNRLFPGAGARSTVRLEGLDVLFKWYNRSAEQNSHLT